MKKQNQKGITLIALIITIIVMLILVGVTINVALNGGLFEKAETATYQTEASLVKEQLEIAKAVAIANNGGNLLEDYSSITVENLSELDEKTKNKFKNKILVNPEGNICYNPENVTAEEKTMLEAIGINAYENNSLTEEEKTEIQALLMRYSTALQNDNTVEAQEAKNALLEKGINLDEAISIQNKIDYTSYIYFHNSKILINDEDLSIIIPTNDEIQIYDELYNVAVTFDNELKNGRPANNGSFSITYNGEEIIAYYMAGPWMAVVGDFNLHASGDLTTDGKFIGI